MRGMDKEQEVGEKRGGGEGEAGRETEKQTFCLDP